MSVKINGVYKGTSLTQPTKIKVLLKPIKFCGDEVKYSLAAITDYFDDMTGGGLVFIATEKDLPNFPKRIKPFIYVNRTISTKELKTIKKTKEGKKFKFECGCKYEVIPISEFPTDTEFDIVITGHNVDER